MTLRDKAGNRLWKRVTFEIVLPPGTGLKVPLRVFKAGAHRGFSTTDIDMLLKLMVNKTEEQFPLLEFRLVEINAAHFKFVYAKMKQPFLREIVPPLPD